MYNERTLKVCGALKELSETQFKLVEGIINQFSVPYLHICRHEFSDLISDDVLADFGDTLRAHHLFSNEAFTKDKFEYALVKVLINCGSQAEMAARGKRGNDILVNDIPISLKTQADKGIKRESIHISKYMELGRGNWSDNPADLIGLRDSFLHHLQGYERVFTLRCLTKVNDIWEYELVEIPKTLLEEAEKGTLTMQINSKQSPKPGYCDVQLNGSKALQLYFDGGTERKLQIRNLDIKNCVIHATWKFGIYKEPAILD